MIIFNEYTISSVEEINFFMENFRKAAYKEDFVKVADVYEEFLFECHEADVKLQQMISDRLGDDYISFVIIPTQDTDDLTSFLFQLANVNNFVVKRRYEIIYQEFCEKCFKNVTPLYVRLVKFYEDYFYGQS